MPAECRRRWTRSSIGSAMADRKLLANRTKQVNPTGKQRKSSDFKPHSCIGLTIRLLSFFNR